MASSFTDMTTCKSHDVDELRAVNKYPQSALLQSSLLAGALYWVCLTHSDSLLFEERIVVTVGL